MWSCPCRAGELAWGSCAFMMSTQLNKRNDITESNPTTFGDVRTLNVSRPLLLSFYVVTISANRRDATKVLVPCCNNKINSACISVWDSFAVKIFQQVVWSWMYSFSEWAERVDYHVSSHAHSAGDICIISDTFDYSEIFSVAKIFLFHGGTTVWNYFTLKLYYFTLNSVAVGKG